MSSLPNFAEGFPGDPVHRFARQKRILLVLLVVLGGASGVVDYYTFDVPQAESVNVLMGVPLSLLAYAWCRYDAEELGVRLGRSFILFLVFLLAVAYPVYAFRSRGWAGFRLLAWTLLFLLCIGLCELGVMLLWGWLDGWQAMEGELGFW